jgi:hypothetical protein
MTLVAIPAADLAALVEGNLTWNGGGRYHAWSDALRQLVGRLDEATASGVDTVDVDRDDLIQLVTRTAWLAIPLLHADAFHQATARAREALT